MDDVDGRASGVSSTGKYRVYIKGLLELERHDAVEDGVGDSAHQVV